MTLPAGARLLSAFPFQFQLHLQLTVGGLVGAALLAQVFNLFGQLGDHDGLAEYQLEIVWFKLQNGDSGKLIESEAKSTSWDSCCEKLLQKSKYM